MALFVRHYSSTLNSKLSFTEVYFIHFINERIKIIAWNLHNTKLVNKRNDKISFLLNAQNATINNNKAVTFS